MNRPVCTTCNGKGSPSGSTCFACRPKRGSGSKRYLILLGGALLGSNISVEGATSTALAMAGDEPLAILDSKTALVVARVGGVS